jgi:hypothetical protein
MKARGGEGLVGTGMNGRDAVAPLPNIQRMARSAIPTQGSGGPEAWRIESR